MAKRIIIKDSDKLVKVDGFPVLRLQGFDYTDGINSENKEEIGNENLVDVTYDESITVDVTMNTNNWGVVDLLSQLVGEKATSDAVYKTGLLLSGTTAIVNLTNASTIFAVGDGISIRDVSAGISYVRRVSLVQGNGVTLADVLPAAAVANDKYAKVNDYTIDEGDFADASVDLIVPVREKSALARTSWIPNCYLMGFDMNYDVNGDSTENYRLKGDMDEDFIGDFMNAYVAIGTRTGATTFTAPIDSDALTDYTAYYLTVNGKKFSAGAVSGGGATYDNAIDSIARTDAYTWTITVDSAVVPSLAAEDRIRLVYYLTTVDSTQYTTLDDRGLISIKKGMVKIRLGDEYNVAAGSSVGTNKTINLQSVSIGCSFNRQTIYELGTTNACYRTLDLPVITDVTVDMYESDLKFYAEVAGKLATTGTPDTDWDNLVTAGDVLKPSDFIGQDNRLIVEVYDDNTQTNLLKKIEVEKLKVASKGNRLSVGGFAMISWGFRADNISIAGQGIPADSRLDEGFTSESPFPNNYGIVYGQD